MLEPLGFYITTMYEKTANEKTPVSNLVYESYNNGLEAALATAVGDSVKCASAANAVTACQGLGREIFFDFASRLFLDK